MLFRSPEVRLNHEKQRCRAEHRHRREFLQEIVAVVFEQAHVAGMGIGAKRPVYIWQKDNPTPQAVLTGHKDDIYRVRFNAAGNRLWSIGYAGNLKVWDLGTKQPILEMTTGVVSYSVALSPDGNRAIISSNDRVARIIDVPANAK